MSKSNPHKGHKPRILLAEDDLALRKMLRINFENEGWTVAEAEDGPRALHLFRNTRVDVAVLDVMLPEIDGFSICQSIRLEGNRTPVLFLTAKNDGEDRVQGLKLGGDDYLGKPFNIDELILRLKKLMRLTGQSHGEEVPDVLAFGRHACQIDFNSYEILTWKGERRSISKRETHLLRLLAMRAGEVVSREEILETVWGYDVFPSTRTIDNYILAFRKYFEENPKEPKHFFSVRGVGYRFEIE